MRDKLERFPTPCTVFRALNYLKFACLVGLLCGLDASFMAIHAQTPGIYLFANGGATLVNSNNAIEPNEVVTVRLGIKNIGTLKTSNLVATIQTGNGVLNPAPPKQNYGAMMPNGASVARDFTFKADATNNALLVITLALEADGRDAGTVSYKFRVNPIITTLANPEMIQIRDLTSASPYPSRIVASNILGPITKVEVTLSNLWHTFPADMDILLVSPAGDAVMLMSDACGETSIYGQDVTFSPDSTNLPPFGPGILFSDVLPSNYDPLDDYFLPPAPLFPFSTAMAAFNGRDANGQWNLFIMDDSGGDEGMIGGGWTLKLTTASPANLPAPTLVAPQIMGTGRFRFEVRGTPAERYTIEAASELLLFSPLDTFTMPGSGRYLYECDVAPPQRFFRAVTEP